MAKTIVPTLPSLLYSFFHEWLATKRLPPHGIAHAIRSGSGDVLQVETGSLYPALHRLERRSWVKAEWRQTDNNQRAKFYILTVTGKKQLVEEQGRWARMSAAIGGLMTRGEA